MAYLAAPPKEEEIRFFVQTGRKIVTVAVPKTTTPIDVATEYGGRVIRTDYGGENTRKAAVMPAMIAPIALNPTVTAPAALTPTAAALPATSVLTPVTEQAQVEPFDWTLPLITGAVVAAFAAVKIFTKPKRRSR